MRDDPYLVFKVVILYFTLILSDVSYLLFV